MLRHTRRALATKVIIPRHRDGIRLQKGETLADAKCVASRGGTVVHASVSWRWASTDDALYFTGGGAPLHVDFRHPSSAAGLPPSTASGRENVRASDQEILAARNIDRALRPRFYGDGFLETVRVDVEVASSDGDGDVVTLGANAASCALALAGVPWKGPVGAARLSRRGSSFTRDPPLWFCENSGFDLLYATDGVGCVSLELGCAPTKDALLKDALLEAHAAAAPIVDAINALAPHVDVPRIHEERARLDALASQAAQRHVSQLIEFFGGRNLRDDEDPSSKRDRGRAQDRAFFDVIEAVSSELDGDERAVKAAAARAVEALGREAMAQAASNNARSDRRRTDELRVLQSRCGTLQVPHGSSSFSRGETRVDSTVTLAAPPSRRVPSLDADPNASFREHAAWRRTDPRVSRRRRPRESNYDRDTSSSLRNIDRRFTLHYDFPSSATGDTKDILRANRRAVGHGALAERALAAVFPSRSRFPYATVVRTNVAASSGSTSMASICAASLALHDCGVPLRAPVAGSSIGLSGSTLLTDPTGTEDHFGSMDCKVAGTERGATAAQVDVKGDGVSLEVLGEAFSRASTARREILGHMDSCVLSGDREPRRPRSSDAPFLLVDDDDVVEAPAPEEAPPPPSFLARLFGAAPEPTPEPEPEPERPPPTKRRPPTAARPRPRLKRHAPRVAVVTFDASRVGDLIGPRGEHLREIEDETGADIDARTVSGEATIFADSMRQCSAARKLVLDIVGEIRVGDEVRGTVTDVRDYGCVVRFSRSREGLVHKSEYRGWPHSPEDLTVGADKAFHVIGVDAVLGVVKLSRRRRTAKPRPPPASQESSS